MKNYFLPFITLILTYCLAGCYYDSEEALLGKPGEVTPCDTTVTNFSAQVKPILLSNCYSCHSNAHAAGSGSGIRLQDYPDVKFFADNGKLVGTIQHTSGYYAMPLNGGQLTPCEINTIKLWIKRGTLNN